VDCAWEAVIQRNQFSGFFALRPAALFHWQGDFVQVFTGEKVQAVAFPPRTNQPIGAFPFHVTSGITFEGPEIGCCAVNDVRIGVLGPCD